MLLKGKITRNGKNYKYDAITRRLLFRILFNELNKMIDVLCVILPFPCLYVLFFSMFHILHAYQPLSLLAWLNCVKILPRFVVFYTQSLVLLLQYHITTTKHATVPLYMRYVLLCVRCILHTFTCTNATISHNNNQTCYRSPCLYGMFFYVYVVFYPQSLVLMLHYHISTNKHSTIPLFIRHVLLYVRCILDTITSTNA